MKECLDLLVDLTFLFRVNMQWIPGHSDIIGNYELYELAGTDTTTIRLR